ncbi:cellulose binding domain-containing protein [Actinomadura sp. DC4]|uniref:cellulose binding domain-containing protein n=1 Tax=Actinomadura sp. DC4 TaxID=3055069 RepID=UPI0025AF5F71|nr:cellulose binding domain-containing protein [Actinomadura sp. DC4]MDN3354414.1 cellulose binding domain-containing protein [Actinomadura sp. DC4]
MSAHRARHPRRRRLALWTAGGLTTVVGITGAALFVTTGPADAASIKATYKRVSAWDGGYSAQYTLTNTGAEAIHGWNLQFDLPSGTKVSSLWDGVYSAGGTHVQVKNASWNADLGPGGSTVVGFVAQGATSAPSACQVNGSACENAGDTQAPSPPPPAATLTATPEPTKSAPPTPPKSSSSGGFSPYVDVGLFPPYDLVDAARRTGVKTFNLAFVVSGGGCAPKWGGSQELGDNEVAKKIGDLRAAGGDVRVSFGGANGTELAQACTSAGDLATAYKKVIDAFDLKKVDFDIEGAAIADKTANDRRAEAITTLQKQVGGLDVSFTLPVLPSGLTQDGVNLLSSAKAKGTDVAAVNVMAMDYGDGQAPNPDGKMGDYAIQAATSTEKQVEQALGVGDAWSKIAITPMIGVNDTSTEVFRPADATKVAAFAKEKKLAWTSMWSATRDKPCPGGAQSTASATCSSIDQAADAFTKAFTG